MPKFTFSPRDPNKKVDLSSIRRGREIPDELKPKHDSVEEVAKKIAEVAEGVSESSKEGEDKEDASNNDDADSNPREEAKVKAPAQTTVATGQAILKTNQPKVDLQNALYYMGYGGRKPDAYMSSVIEECVREIEPKIIAKSYYEISDVIRDEEGKITLANGNLELTGTSIEEHLSHCSKVAMCVETISEEVDKLIEASQQDDITKGLIYDALANSAIELVRKDLEKRIAAEHPEYKVGWQFGIGYGDLPITLLDPFLKVLKAEERIGVKTNGSDIMIPMKSVAGIIDLTEKEPEAEEAEEEDNSSSDESGESYTE